MLAYIRAILLVGHKFLSREQSPDYFDLIAEFESLTGVGGLLNTSFNLHGEPIVQDAQDAARVFRMSGLDLLVLDGYMVEKKSAY